MFILIIYVHCIEHVDIPQLRGGSMYSAYEYFSSTSNRI